MRRRRTYGRPPRQRCDRCGGTYYGWREHDLCASCAKALRAVTVEPGFSLREMIDRRRAERGFPSAFDTGGGEE